MPYSSQGCLCFKASQNAQRRGWRVFSFQTRTAPWFRAPSAAHSTPRPMFLPSQWEAFGPVLPPPAAPPRSLRNAASRAIFSPPSFCGPTYSPLPPTGSHLNACRPVCSGKPPPPQDHLSHSPDHGEVGSGFTKGPRRGEPAPCWLPGSLMGSGFGWWLWRERQRAKSWSPPPPWCVSPPPRGPVRVAQGPPGLGGTDSERVGEPREFWWQNILGRLVGTRSGGVPPRGHPLPASQSSADWAHPAAGVGG